MTRTEMELLTALWGGPRCGDDLYNIFAQLPWGGKAFNNVIRDLVIQGWIELDGRDSSLDDIFKLTAYGLDAVGKRLYASEVGKGGITANDADIAAPDCG